jgi:hypothetical protein
MKDPLIGMEDERGWWDETISHDGGILAAIWEVGPAKSCPLASVNTLNASGIDRAKPVPIVSMFAPTNVDKHLVTAQNPSRPDRVHLSLITLLCRQSDL